MVVVVVVWDGGAMWRVRVDGVGRCHEVSPVRGE